MNISSLTAALRLGAVLALVAVSSGGCYWLQSAQGQFALMSKREPISRVIDRPSTPAALRTQLEAVTDIRDFASRELGLPDNGSYRSYADVGRPYVVWNVVAAPEFSVDPKKWCYPFVGCVAYRGYFVEERARRFAAGLRGEGWDAAVGGVAAYSTLGHFNDPILNTMVGWDDVELASIVFHELTHQLLYVPGRFLLQRSARHRGGGGGGAPLADRTRTRGGAVEAPGAAGALPEGHRSVECDACRTARNLCIGNRAGCDARAQARGVRRTACLLCRAQGRLGAGGRPSMPGSTPDSTMPIWRPSPLTMPAFRDSSAN